MEKLDKALVSAVSEILFNSWDPIGVRSIGGPKDEYDSYAATLVAKRKDITTEGRISEFLLCSEVERMQIHSNGENAEATAKLLYPLLKL